jgi:hypothetical protein
MNKLNKGWLAAGAVFAIFVFCAWRSNAPDQLMRESGQTTNQDTTPRKKYYSDKNEFTIGDIDKAMREMERAMADMPKNMNIDFNQINKEIAQAMEQVKKVDFAKLDQEIKTSMKNIDWESLRKETDKAMREAEARLKEVDLKEVSEQMEKLKTELDSKKFVDMESVQKSVDAGLAGAKLGMEKARIELAKFKEFIDTLDKDGLIDKEKAYRVEIKSGELYIDGTKQSKEKNDKYSKYFRDEDYTIKSDGKGVTRL